MEFKLNGIDQALEFANYQATLSQQRKLIRQRFEDKCVVAFAGGLFKVTPEFIAGTAFLTDTWVIDSNGNPINVGPIKPFIDLCTKTYNDALIDYGLAYDQIKKQRSVSSLVGV
jgi:hypothetical protein